MHIDYLTVYANFDLVRNVRTRLVWWKTCGLLTKVLVVSNPHKIFCIVFCGIKLATRLFLVWSYDSNNTAVLCFYLHWELFSVEKKNLYPFNIGTYSEFPLCKGGGGVSCRNSNNYTGFCCGVQGPGLVANNKKRGEDTVWEKVMGSELTATSECNW